MGGSFMQPEEDSKYAFMLTLRTCDLVSSVSYITLKTIVFNYNTIKILMGLLG